MKLCTWLTAFLVLGGSWAYSQDKGTDQQKLFQEYMEKYGPPGPEHKNLDPLVGDWQAKAKMWMDPSAPPQVSEGLLQRKSIMGGRFVQEDYNGKIMDKPFQGLGTMGYDRAKKKYVATWLDSVSTAIHLSYGTYDETAKTWTFKQEDVCPITNKPVKMRDTLRIVSPTEQHMEMYRQLGDERETKFMEIHLTRMK